MDKKVMDTSTNAGQKTIWHRTEKQVTLYAILLTRQRGTGEIITTQEIHNNIYVIEKRENVKWNTNRQKTHRN